MIKLIIINYLCLSPVISLTINTLVLIVMVTIQNSNSRIDISCILPGLRVLLDVIAGGDHASRRQLALTFELEIIRNIAQQRNQCMTDAQRLRRELEGLANCALPFEYRRALAHAKHQRIIKLLTNVDQFSAFFEMLRDNRHWWRHTLA